ncbi:oxidoreductase [Allostella vacuolata]|nr:oxidoreductase [Stella vacuolata]
MTTDAPPATPGRWRPATIARIAPLTPHVRSFFLSIDPPPRFQAGQHMDVRLTAPDGYQAQRSYSIASAPGSTVELTIERLADGEVSPFFHDVAVAGDEIEVRGPIGGHFVWQPAMGGPVLLIGGGSGVVPLMSMARHHAAAAPAVPMRLLFSARTWDEVIWRDELLALDARGDGFGLTLALTRDAPRRPGDHGRRVDAAMVADLLAGWPAPPAHVFVCGANPFVGVAVDAVLAAGVPPRRVRTERYGG